MTATAAPPPHADWPRAGMALAALLALTLALYFDTARGMVTIWWRSDTFTHAFLVPPIVGWLVWRRRERLAQLPPRPSAWGLPLLALTGLAWLLGDLVAVNALTQLALVALLALLTPTLLGLAVARTLLFPLAFLFFAVPFGEFAMPQLMEWTADFTVLALRLSGIPVYREGLQFVIPSGNWSVVEACSGVRYLIASLTVGTLFAYLNYQSAWRRVVFIGVSILVPIVANWLRAYLIVLLGHLSGNKLAAGVDHLIYGWVFFGVVILLMFMVGARWSEPEPDPQPAPRRALPQSGTGQPLRRPYGWGVAGLAGLALAWPLAARWALDHDQNPAPVPLAAPAQLSPDWVLQADASPVFQPAFDNPSAQINAQYAQAGQRVGLYVGYYRQQNYQRKLVSSENVLVKSKDPLWAQVASGSQSVHVDGIQVNFREGELRKVSGSAGLAPERLTVWQVYWVDGLLTPSNAQAKLQGAWQRLSGRGDDAAAIILYTDRGAGDEGRQRLAAFVQTNGARILQLLRSTQTAQP